MFQYLDKIEASAPTSGEFTTVGDYIAVVFNYALGIGVSITVIGVILAGIKYMGARSDPKKMEEARDAFFWSIAAMLLVMGAYGITLAVTNTLGSAGPVAKPITQPAKPGGPPVAF